MTYNVFGETLNIAQLNSDTFTVCHYPNGGLCGYCGPLRYWLCYVLNFECSVVWCSENVGKAAEARCSASRSAWWCIWWWWNCIKNISSLLGITVSHRQQLEHGRQPVWLCHFGLSLKYFYYFCKYIFFVISQCNVGKNRSTSLIHSAVT